jgi:hypothetical protein
MSKIKIDSAVTNKVSKRKLGVVKSFCTYETKTGNKFKAAMVKTSKGTFRYLVHNLKPFVK